MLVGAALVLTLVVWMWRSAPHFEERDRDRHRAARRAGRQRRSGCSCSRSAWCSARASRPRSSCPPPASTARASALWLGALIGLTLAAVFGVLFVRGTLRVPLKPFFTLTSRGARADRRSSCSSAACTSCPEARVLPSSRAEMALIGPFVKNELLLFALTIALAAALAPARAASGAAGRRARRRARRRVSRAPRARASARGAAAPV